MVSGLSRPINYAVDFYLRRLKLILVFSIPFLFAFLLPVLVSAPTYLSLGGVFLRTGSIPELSIFDIIITTIAYAVTVFLIADTIVNINIVVRSKRTLTSIKTEIMEALGSYALRIFYIYTLMILLLFVAQLITYDTPFQPWIYPLFAYALSFLLFFVPPAVVIDNSDTPTAIKRSISLALKKPGFVFVWSIIALGTVSVTKILGDLVFSSFFSGYFVLIVNSLILLPFLTVLQTQMYMEKYPLAR